MQTTSHSHGDVTSETSDRRKGGAPHGRTPRRLSLEREGLAPPPPQVREGDTHPTTSEAKPPNHEKVEGPALERAASRPEVLSDRVGMELEGYRSLFEEIRCGQPVTKAITNCYEGTTSISALSHEPKSGMQWIHGIRAGPNLPLSGRRTEATSPEAAAVYSAAIAAFGHAMLPPMERVEKITG